MYIQTKYYNESRISSNHLESKIGVGASNKTSKNENNYA